MAYIGTSQSADEAVARATRQLSSSDADQVARGLMTFMSQLLTDQSSAGGQPRLSGDSFSGLRVQASSAATAAKPSLAMSIHSAF